METGSDGSQAKDAAAIVGSAAPMVRPWEDLKPDPDGLVAAPVSFTAWIEATCDRSLGALVKCDFRWFAESTELSDHVETGPQALWKDPLNPDVEPQPLEPDPTLNTASAGKKKKDQKTASPAPEAVPPSPVPGSEDVPEVPVLRRFEKKSPSLQASCKFVRRLANLSLSVRVHYPSFRPTSSRPQTSQTQATSEVGERVEAPSILTKEFSLPLCPLLVRGSSPEVMDDICVALGCDGVESLRIGVRCDGPVLSDDVARHLNPMLVTLEGVHKLPQDEHLGQTRDEVHAVLNAFGERRLAPPQTLDSRGGAKYRFHNTFFVGTWNWHELRDFVQTERCAIEVHDRGMPSMVAMRPNSQEAPSIPSDPKVAPKAGAKKGAVVESQLQEGVTDSCVEKAESHNNANATGHFGVARFSLAEIASMRRAQPLSMRVAIEPAAVGSGASGNLPGKRRREKASAEETVSATDQTAETAEVLKIDAPVLAHEHAPGYIDNNSYVSLTVTLARPLHPQPLPQKRPEPEPPLSSPELVPPAQETSRPSSEQQKKAEEENGGIDSGQPAVERYERFQRIVLIMKYRQTSKLKSLLHLVKETNASAVAVNEEEVKLGSPDEENKASEEEKKVVLPVKKVGSPDEVVETGDNPVLGDDADILTGFVFLDRRYRIVVIEGLRSGAAWEKVLEIAGVGIERNTKNYRIRYHPHIGFRHRLYGDFGLSLKQVKLRVSSLEKLLLRPELYNSTKSDQEAVAALMTLAEVKRAERLHHLKGSSCFPTSIGMCAVESEYGDIVKDIELEGGCAARDDADSGSDKSKTTTTTSRKSHLSPKSHSPRSVAKSSRPVSRQVESRLVEKEESEASEDSFDDIPIQRPPRLSMKAPLECDNAAYRRSVSIRNSMRPTDFTERNKEAIIDQSNNHTLNNTLGKKVPDKSFLEGLTVVHMYSGQALNTAELQKRAIRKKLEGREHEVLLTYSEDKMSGVFPLLEQEVNLSNALRAADPNYKDSREPWQYPKPRDSSHYRKPDRDVSDARKDDLKDVWDEGALSTKLECRKGPMHNVFDAKSLGIGGAHVIELRRPGLRNVGGKAPPPATRLEREIERGPLCPRLQKDEMKIASFNNMGSMNTVDKYNRGILESAPLDKAFRFKERRVPDHVAEKYGRGRFSTTNVEPAPVSIQISEDFREEPRNSIVPFHLAAMCAKDVTVRMPLSAREKRAQELSSKQPLSGTLAGWQKTGRTGAHLTFQKPAFAPQAVTPMPLSAR